MTKQEAIEILRDTPIDIRSTREDDIHTLYATAQGMAIEALSCSEKPNELQPPRQGQRDGGMIYRQDAIDALCKAVDAKGEYEGEWLYTDEFCKVVNDLPSAQPKPCKDAVSKAEVLEVYADLYDVFDDNKMIQKELHKVYDKLNDLPSAQPEQRWIPTRIAKPPQAGQYLVTKQQKTGVRQIATAHYNPSFDEWSGNGNFTKVLAWQQLPTPYTQE